jgi:hypothetical protein
MKTSNNGYILVLTLMMLSILIIIVTSMFYNETAHTALTRTMIEREKAKMLALGGVQLAISKLITPQKKEKEPKEVKEKNQKEKKDKKENDQQNKKQINLLKKVLPSLNRWQTIKLNDDIDDINGQIKFCISCEEGKININEIYNYSTHKFKEDVDTKFDINKILEEFSSRIRQITGDKDIIKGLQQFLSRRKYPLNETTELLEIQEFSYFNNHVFYEPQKSNEAKRPIYLTDIFTIWTDSSKLQPWMLSDSILAILGLKRSEVGDVNQRQKMLEQSLKAFKQTSDWKADWDKILKPLYGKDFESLIKGIENLFSNQFDPKTFSVLSYGTVGEITQRVFAILEIESDSTRAKLKKLYWI